MLRFISVILLSCFLTSIICVPEGDFSLLAQLPVLYQHCKETEDTDMNFIDFVINHLINIEIISAKHLEGNDKPHQPFRFQNFQHILTYTIIDSNISVITPVIRRKKINCLINNAFHSNYISSIFHPPNIILLNAA